MKENLKKNYLFTILFLLIFIFHQYIYQQFFPNSNGLVGHDYKQFIPNFMFGKVWFKNNFFSVPWFSPSFCCGVPFFADPQTMFYSIPQIIFLIFNPILALKIFFFVFSGFAYVGTYLLLRKNFKLNNYTSLLCAGLFLFNGFFVYRAIAGHVAYLSYIFIPLYCFFLISSLQNKSNYIYLVLSSIVFANFFHSGSGPIILIIFFSILCILLLYSHLENSLKIFSKFIISIVIGITISSSKIISGLFFLSNFPRQYQYTEFETLFSFIKIFFQSFFLKPNQEYFNNSVESMFPFGIHEMEYSLSIVPLILIFLINRKYLKFNQYNIRFILLIIVIFITPIFLNVNFLNQFVIISKIPILNSTWVQFRWMAVYIIPLIIISGLIIEKSEIKFEFKKYLVTLFILILLMQNFIKDNGWHFSDQKYDIKNAVDFSKRIKKDESIEISGPAILMNQSGSPKKIDNPNDMFFFSYSPLLCYQPIFGYGLEKLNTKQIVFNSKSVLEDNSFIYFSNKLDTKDNHYMFFNPSCFLFSKENSCLPGDTFKISEKKQLVNFTSYKKFEFKKNKIQAFSNYISILALIICILYLLYHLSIFIYNFRSKK